ncbi:MAG: hypothetical protein GC202_02200 [Alphaproteobacteria bacterium]|nr:hypothetical protein [Alphaproteobacteria bacterium]
MTVPRETSFHGNDTPPGPLRRDGADWTAWEDLQLTARRANGQSFAELAALLGRTERACRKHAFKIGAVKASRATREKAARGDQALLDRLQAAEANQGE